MINFKIDLHPVRFYGTHEFFDDSELSMFTRKEREGIWFDINPLTGEKIDEMLERNTSTAPVTSPGEKPDDKLDSKGYSHDMIDYIINAWGGINVNGKSFGCNKGNKIAFCSSYQRVHLALTKCAKWANAVNSSTADTDKEDEENLPPLQDGQKNTTET